MKELIENIKQSEGFRGVVYKDTLGFDTIGFGTKLPISEDEAALILEYRLKQKIKELEAREPFINKLPLEKQEIIAEMCYQMGVSSVLRFKKMWEALKRFDYEAASEQMLDSAWAKQMHAADMQDGKDSINRAERLAEIIRQ